MFTKFVLNWGIVLTKFLQTFQNFEFSINTKTSNFSKQSISQFKHTLFQFSVAGHMCQKLDFAFKYLENTGVLNSNQSKSFVLSGGVAANSVIRGAVENVAKYHGYTTRIPPKELVVDNAIMCAWTAIEMLLAGWAS